jgi:hypothetical protein
MAQRATLPYLTLVQVHCQNKFVIDATQLRTLNNLHENTWQNPISSFANTIFFKDELSSRTYSLGRGLEL